jgi:hypothetical protein
MTLPTVPPTLRRWQHGQTEIDELLGSGLLERREGNVTQAFEHLAEAERFVDLLLDPETTDGELRARLSFRALAACALALLTAQGLHPSARGGLEAVERAVTAQFHGGPGPGVFDGLCALAAATEHAGSPSAVDVPAAATSAVAAVSYTSRLLDGRMLRPFTAG